MGLGKRSAGSGLESHQDSLNHELGIGCNSRGRLPSFPKSPDSSERPWTFGGFGLSRGQILATRRVNLTPWLLSVIPPGSVLRQSKRSIQGLKLGEGF